MTSELFEEQPYSLQAEQAVIGGVLANPQLAGRIELPAADFYQPIHETIWRTISDLAGAGKPTDPVSVLDALTTAGLAARIGGAPYLHDCLQTATLSAGLLSDHVEIVRNHATVRRTLEALDEARRVVRSAGSTDPEQILERVERLIGAVPSRDSGDYDSLMTLDEFLDRDLGPVEWVIPGLLAKRERLIVTAGEGVGKSTLMRQFALCAAAGMHPLTGRSFPAVKTLVIDCENEERIMQEELDLLRSAIRAHGNNPGHRLMIDRREEGLDLADPADRRWLSRRVEAMNPDLLVIGPAYKLYVGGSKDRDEDLARSVTSYLDKLRSRHGFALILEHHSAKGHGGGKRTIEPFGSSLWMRWPEFGIGLSHAEHPAGKDLRLVDVTHWRGQRARGRVWPFRLQAGEGLPWVESRLLD